MHSGRVRRENKRVSIAESSNLVLRMRRAQEGLVHKTQRIRNVVSHGSNIYPEFKQANDWRIRGPRLN